MSPAHLFVALKPINPLSCRFTAPEVIYRLQTASRTLCNEHSTPPPPKPSKNPQKKKRRDPTSGDEPRVGDPGGVRAGERPRELSASAPAARPTGASSGSTGPSNIADNVLGGKTPGERREELPPPNAVPSGRKCSTAAAIGVTSRTPPVPYRRLVFEEHPSPAQKNKRSSARIISGPSPSKRGLPAITHEKTTDVMLSSLSASKDTGRRGQSGS